MNFSGWPLTDVAALNLAEALDYFWGQPESFEAYFDADRMAFFEIVSAEIADLHPEPTDLTVLDVGCGPGQMFNQLVNDFAPLGYWLDMLGIDFAQSAIDRARKLVPGARFRCDDLYTVDLPTDWADLVLCVECLEHQIDWSRALERMLLWCKPGGHIIITMPDKHYDSWHGHRQLWTMAQFRANLEYYGLVEASHIRGGRNLLGVLKK